MKVWSRFSSSPSWKGIPVFFLTGNCPTEGGHGIALCCLHKPFNQSELVASVAVAQAMMLERALPPIPLGCICTDEDRATVHVVSLTAVDVFEALGLERGPSIAATFSTRVSRAKGLAITDMPGGSASASAVPA